MTNALEGYSMLLGNGKKLWGERGDKKMGQPCSSIGMQFLQFYCYVLEYAVILYVVAWYPHVLN